MKPPPSYYLHIDGSTTEVCFVLLNRNKRLVAAVQPAYKGDSVTTNEGEYWALIHGLSELSSQDIWKATIFSDSELLVRQINGLYKVKTPSLIRLHAIARAFLDTAGYEVRWINRKKNLAGIILEERKKYRKSAQKKEYLKL